ncbi:KH domain-containing protein [Lapidilactobacillus bayanensis]|uniref:KH domain-containing protein n=1 Tax=Lapidilactobacillus bayanensis TaxID=2485998 RepID=UPI000F7B115D|nr:KH domain-containing protein [Lapidilactobacillus bayanensis]
MKSAEVSELISAIVSPLITMPDELTIETVDDTRFTTYNLSLNRKDIGRVIGKQGRVAQAIRTLIYGIRLDNGKRIRLNIVDK